MCHEMSCFVMVRSPPRPFPRVRGRALAGHRASFSPSTVPDTPAAAERPCFARNARGRAGGRGRRVRAPDARALCAGRRGSLHRDVMFCHVRFHPRGRSTGSPLCPASFRHRFLRSRPGSVPVSRARLRVRPSAPPCAKRRAGRRARLSRPLAPGYLRRPSHRFPAQKSRKATPHAAFLHTHTSMIFGYQAYYRNYYGKIMNEPLYVVSIPVLPPGTVFSAACPVGAGAARLGIQKEPSLRAAAIERLPHPYVLR